MPNSLSRQLAARPIDWRRLLPYLLLDARLNAFWGCAGAIGFALVAVLLPESPARVSLRWSGAALELLGLLTIAQGMRETRQRFRRPSGWQQFKQGIPRRGTVIGPLSGSANITLSGVGLLSDGTVKRPERDSIEVRLLRLEQDVRDLRIMDINLKTAIDSEATERRRVVSDEATKRASEDGAIRKLIDDAVAGGLSMEWVGLVWLAVGLFLSALAGDF